MNQKQIEIDTEFEFGWKKFKCVEWKDPETGHFRCGMCDFDGQFYSAEDCRFYHKYELLRRDNKTVLLEEGERPFSDLKNPCEIFRCDREERADGKSVFFTEVKKED